MPPEFSLSAVAAQALTASALFMYSPQPRPSPRRVLSMVWTVACVRCAGWFPEIVPGTENDFVPDFNEHYCACEAGKWRRIKDDPKGATP
jgi:hypothetical protein